MNFRMRTGTPSVNFCEETDLAKYAFFPSLSIPFIILVFKKSLNKGIFCSFFVFNASLQAKKEAEMEGGLISAEG